MAMDAQRAELTQDKVAALYAAKAAAELGDAESLARAPKGLRGWRGAPLAELAFVISALSDADRAAGEPLRGPTGEAAEKAAAALRVEGASLFVVASRPVADLDPATRAQRLVLAIEAADPAIVIALDTDAARDLSEAFEAPPLEFGRPVRVRGRVFGAAGDLGASLGDTKEKARVWRAMRAIAVEGGLKETGRHSGAL